MDAPIRQKKMKRNIIIKTWERCKSLGRALKTGPPTLPRTTSTAGTLMRKSKSWNRDGARDPRRPVVAPEGYFSVYVGPEKQRFLIKTEYANHPLFIALLEEAQSEYGYSSSGPLELPCEVDVFHRVLIEMDNDDDVDIRGGGSGRRRPGGGGGCGCGFGKGYGGAYRLLGPSRMVIAINQS